MENNNQPLFSIITVSYNASKTIQKTISSLLNQSFQDFEYLIIDGGSTDETTTIIEKNKHLFNGKLSFLSEKDNGIYDAMNKGISLSKGKFIGLINSDDWYEPETLQIVYNEILAKPNIDFFYGIQKFYKSGSFFKVESINHAFLPEAPLFHATCFISKTTYSSIGLYDLTYKLASDYDFFLRCYLKNIRFHQILLPLANFSMDGSTSIQKTKSLLETYKIWKKYNYISTKQYLIYSIKTLFLKKLHTLFGKTHIS